MDSVDILFPEHEDIVLYSRRYGYWDYDEKLLKELAEHSAPLPAGYEDIHALYDKIVAAGEYVPLNNEKDCERFVELAILISKDLELDIVITKRARMIDAKFTLPYGLSFEFYSAFIELIKLSHDINVEPKADDTYMYTIQFYINTYQYVKHTSAINSFLLSKDNAAASMEPTVHKDASDNQSCSGLLSDSLLGVIESKESNAGPHTLEMAITARKELQTQTEIAYTQLEALVCDVLTDAITDEEVVERISAELAEWCSIAPDRFLRLDKTLFNHVRHHYPQLIANRMQSDI